MTICMRGPRPTHRMLLRGPRLPPQGALEFSTATLRSCHISVLAGATPPAHSTINQKKKQPVVIYSTIAASPLPLGSALVEHQ
ncbi:hypothetical protein NDU88_005805 [Pleurodeles waltl]|uniref:Uncharacterized protein n=1 Tax=Pleurodeles waltl TaxID=8319 RepID=A0AAV7LQ38_PLEWA|nr:hypothetical protein NDU88_005805 [Pleurodeles waltl]